MMDENGELSAEAAAAISSASAPLAGTISDSALTSANTDEAIDVSSQKSSESPVIEKGASNGVPESTKPFLNGEIRTLDGDIAGDEFASDAINYQVLLGKIEGLLERLKLDA
jgi:ankyrin repeat/BTB/POZ domain-containing protein 1